ncbi:MAG: ATP-binding cassette domain-containing protein [Armatimonadetes bacterium]|nr:ATP-binding cassette domain-containing protein [Armatimonadota bacterium]
MSELRVAGLSYSVVDRLILKGVDLEVRQGEILAVMGMSGSGKTTLLRCIAGLIKPSQGSITVDGEDIVPMTETQLNRVRLRIGLVFQYAALFDSLTVRENVGFGPLQHRTKTPAAVAELVTSLLADVGMPGTEGMLPAELSGGMRKRVGLARALANEPGLLLYDEPTSGLDPVIARTIDDLIVETRDQRGVTSVVVSHDIPSIFRIADRVAMIDQGVIVETGTPTELRRSSDSRVRAFVDA